LLTGEQEKNVLFSTHLRTKEPLDMHVEQFLASLRFENRGKLDDLGIGFDTNTLKPDD